MPAAIPIIVYAAASAAGWSAVAVGIAVAVAGVAAGMLQAKMMDKQSAPDIGNRMRVVRSAVAPRRVVYGECCISGVLVFAESTGSNDDYIHLVLALTGHEVEAIGDVYLNDVLWNSSHPAWNYGRVIKHTGAPDQTADANLVNEVAQWTENHRLRGIAYLYVRLQWKQPDYDHPDRKSGRDYWPTGIPNIKAVVKGKKVFDPRDDSTAYSNNLALCVRDYLSSDYGLNCSDDEIDDDAIVAAANICDEELDIGDLLDDGTGFTRFVCNGSFTMESTPATVLEDLLTAGIGSLVYTQGKYRLKVGAYTDSVGSLDEDDLRAGLKIRPRQSRKDLFNTVQGQFVSPDDSWQPVEFPEVTNSLYVSQDGGEKINRELFLPYTTDAVRAQILAKIVLETARQPITVEFPCKFSGMLYVPGDVIDLTIDRLGWVAKEFKVIGWKMAGDGAGVDLTLQEEASESYDWNNGDATRYDPAPDTNLPDPYAVGLVTNLAAESGSDHLGIASDGTVFARIYVSWTPPTGGFIIHYEVGYKKSGDTVWNNGISYDNNTYIGPATEGELYDVRVRAINSLGASSRFVFYNNHSVVGKTEPPPQVSTFTVSRQSDGTREFVATYPNKPADHAGYRIYSKLGTGQTLPNMDLMNTEGLITAFPFESNALAAGSYTFAITAVDTSGLESLPLYVETTLADPRLGNIAYSEYPASMSTPWPGTKTDCSINYNGYLEADSNTTWATAPATWAAFESWNDGAITPIVYEHPEIDLGFDIAFTPLISMIGNGTPTIEIQWKPDGGSYSSWAAPEPVTARYLKVRVSVAGDYPLIKGLPIVLSAETITEEINDLDISTLTGSYRIAAGDIRLPITKPFTIISQVQLALQSVGPGWTWELIDKDTTTGPRVKIYNGSGTLADATIDAFIRGL